MYRICIDNDMYISVQPAFARKPGQVLSFHEVRDGNDRNDLAPLRSLHRGGISQSKDQRGSIWIRVNIMHLWFSIVGKLRPRNEFCLDWPGNGCCDSYPYPSILHSSQFFHHAQRGWTSARIRHCVTMWFQIYLHICVYLYIYIYIGKTIFCVFQA